MSAYLCVYVSMCDCMTVCSSRTVVKGWIAYSLAPAFCLCLCARVFVVVCVCEYEAQRCMGRPDRLSDGPGPEELRRRRHVLVGYDMPVLALSATWVGNE